MKNQINFITKMSYQGQNQAELQTASIKNGYESNEWLTFLQAKTAGLKIKKGSHGVSVFKGFGKFDDKNKDGERVEESRPLGFARVFNLDQTEKMEVENVEN